MCAKIVAKHVAENQIFAGLDIRVIPSLED